MAQDVIVEMMVDGVAYSKNTTSDDVNLEVYVTPPDTQYKIGGTNPSADPKILVWFDILGAQA